MGLYVGPVHSTNTISRDPSGRNISPERGSHRHVVRFARAAALRMSNTLYPQKERVRNLKTFFFQGVARVPDLPLRRNTCL